MSKPLLDSKIRLIIGLSMFSIRDRMWSLSHDAFSPLINIFKKQNNNTKTNIYKHNLKLRCFFLSQNPNQIMSVPLLTAFSVFKISVLIDLSKSVKHMVLLYLKLLWFEIWDFVITINFQAFVYNYSYYIIPLGKLPCATEFFHPSIHNPSTLILCRVAVAGFWLTFSERLTYKDKHPYTLTGNNETPVNLRCKRNYGILDLRFLVNKMPLWLKQQNWWTCRIQPWIIEKSKSQTVFVQRATLPEPAQYDIYYLIKTINHFDCNM